MTVIATLSAWLDAALQVAFQFHGSGTTWLEIVAAALSVAMVLFNMRVNPAGWPLAIVASLLYALLFWRSRLYGDASLQVFFVVIAGWGWWQWLHGTTGTAPLRVHALTVRQHVLAAVAMAIAWPATGLFLKTFTDTDVPWWDAFPTAASVIGQVLLGRKFIENWLVWIVVNLVGAALFAYKGLWLTAALYAVFAVLSVAGWRAWRRLASTASTSPTSSPSSTPSLPSS